MLHISFSFTSPNIRLQIFPFERFQKVFCFLESLQVSQPYMRAAQIKVLLSIWLSIIAISEYYASLARISLLCMRESSLLQYRILNIKIVKWLNAVPTNSYTLICINFRVRHYHSFCFADNKKEPNFYRCLFKFLICLLNCPNTPTQVKGMNCTYFNLSSMMF
jgi:hypothetical protein